MNGTDDVAANGRHAEAPAPATADATERDGGWPSAADRWEWFGGGLGDDPGEYDEGDEDARPGRWGQLGELVVLIGAAGSGKSTWVADRFPPSHVVSLDALRAMVADDECDQDATPEAVGLMIALLTARTRRGLSTVVDATHLTIGERALVTAVGRSGITRGIIAVVFDVPLPTLLARNAARPEPIGDRVWGRRVPDATVRAQFDAVRPLVVPEPADWRKRERFDAVHVVSG